MLIALSLLYNYDIHTKDASEQHNPVANNMKWVLLTFKHNLLETNHSHTIRNSLLATVRGVFKETSENRTVVSSANKVKMEFRRNKS